MKKIQIVLSAFAITLFACNSADQQAPQIAQDFCNCFTPVTNKLGPQAKDIVIRSANESNYAQALEKEITKLSSEEQMKVSQELMVFSEMNSPSSSVNKCITDVQEKYKNALTTDKDAFMQKIIKELEKKEDCKVTAGLLKVGLQVEGNK